MAAFHAKEERLRDAPASVTARDPKDRYETPDDVVRALMGKLGHLFEGGRAVDPCCGTGRVVRVLQAMGFSASGTDIEEDGLDFLSQEYADHAHDECLTRADVVTNPPFSHAREFVERALELFSGRVAMLLPQDFLGSAGRRDWLAGQGRPGRILAIPWRIKFFKRDGTQISGQAYAHQWIVWEPRGHRPAMHTLYDWAELTPDRAQRVAVGSGQYNRAGKQMWARLNEGSRTQGAAAPSALPTKED